MKGYQVRRKEFWVLVAKVSAISIFVVTLLLFDSWVIFGKDLSGHNFIHFPTLRIFLAVNVLLLSIAIIVIFVLFHKKNLYQIRNDAKDRAISAVNRISRLTTWVSNIDYMAYLICRKLNETLGGEFWLLIADNKYTLKFHKPYMDKARQILDDPDTVSFDEHPVMHEDGKIIYFQPILRNGKKIGVLVAKVSSDNPFIYLRETLPDQISIIISNLKIRIKLNRTRIKHEKEVLRSLILSSISHDLKTPLSSIIGGLRIISELTNSNKLNTQDGKILISTTLEEAERLKDFISDVLEMTKIESGAIVLQRQYLDLSMITDRILKRFSDQLQNYTVEVALDQNVRVYFDPTSYEQVIHNLIDNTIKHSPEKTIIKIWDSLEQDLYSIFIKNEGYGIDQEKLNTIFSKFERFIRNDKAGKGGLGLNIVKALMEVNDANIEAKIATDYQGVVFILKFHNFKNEADLF